uniref:sporulation initiation factor Spo0A C-terminal domain-containing protein n=1 Tax=Clostridioides difficile TaxID=1496 RepID=UPI0031B57111
MKRGVYMIGFKKRDTKDLLKVIARQHGISVTEVRAEMQATIDEARNNPDPEKQAEFSRYFGDRTPTPEEFISTMTKKLNRKV